MRVNEVLIPDEHISPKEGEEAHIPKTRLGKCEVCDINNAKYTCPECEVKTCCLACVKIHKHELDCSGIRNKVKFKPLKKFTNMDLRSDYTLLEDATRALDCLKKQSRKFSNYNSYNLPRIYMKKACERRNIKLFYLPKTFTRHKKNSTYLNWKEDKLFWKVTWVFPDADMLSVSDQRVSENMSFNEALDKYLVIEKCDNYLKNALQPYHGIERGSLKVLLKLENIKQFFLVDKDDSLLESLSQKEIIEHPIFYVILNTSSQLYKIISPVQDSSVKKFSSNYKGENLLFDSVEGLSHPKR